MKLVEMCCSARPRGMCERVRGGGGVRVESGVEGAQKRNKAIDLWLFRRFAPAVRERACDQSLENWRRAESERAKQNRV